MCTKKCAQPEGHFQRLGGLLTNHLDQNPNNDKLSSEKVHCRKVFATFSRSLKCSKFKKVQKRNFFGDRFRKWENSLGTNIEHMQSSERLPSLQKCVCEIFGEI